MWDCPKKRADKLPMSTAAHAELVPVVVLAKNLGGTKARSTGGATRPGAICGHGRLGLGSVRPVDRGRTFGRRDDSSPAESRRGRENARWRSIGSGGDASGFFERQARFGSWSRCTVIKPLKLSKKL